MKTACYLKEMAAAERKRPMPILSFPAVQKLNVTVRELVSNGELMARAMKTVADSVPSAASVSMMDLSLEAEAFGAKIRFSDDEIPTVTGQLVADEAAAEALQLPQVGAGRTLEALKGIRKAKELIQDRPVLSGVIGPFSLAGRLMDVTEIMYLCFDEPELVHKVLQKATDFLISYCKAFREVGADGVVMAEPLAGLMSGEMCAEFSTPYVKQILDAVRTEDFAFIYHNCGNTVIKMLDQLFALHADAYHFGNAVDMKQVMAQAPADVLCMGNIDPAGQFAQGTPVGVRLATLSLLEAVGRKPNYLPSSGCDIPPRAKWQNIEAFFQACEDFYR